LADALGRPFVFHLAVGEAADCRAYEALIGLPERTPGALLADKGYDAAAIRADLAERKIEAVVPGRSNCRVKIEHGRALYKPRNRIERMFGHLKINRAIATRHDQLANGFLGMVHLATPPPDTGSNLSTLPSLCRGARRLWLGIFRRHALHRRSGDKMVRQSPDRIERAANDCARARGIAEHILGEGRIWPACRASHQARKQLSHG